MFNSTKPTTSPLIEKDYEDSATDDRIPEEPETLYEELKSLIAETEDKKNINTLILPQTSVPHEKPKSMEFRKLSNEKLVRNTGNTGNTINTVNTVNTTSARTSSDVKRKKLEVELRAAEEIARLKESVIEKRLAYELANLQESFDCHPFRTTLPPPPPPPPPLPPAPAVFHTHHPTIPLHQSESHHYSPKRRYQTPESCPVQEREFTDHGIRTTTRTPILPVSSGHSRQSSPIAIKLFKTDSSSSILNSIRNLGMLDKKFSMDKKNSLHNDLKTASPMHLPPAPRSPSYRECRYKTNDRNSCHSKNNSVYNVFDAQQHPQHIQQHPQHIQQQPQLQPQPQPQSSKPSTPSKAKAIWKMAIAKIKKKIKSSKSTPPDADHIYAYKKK